MALVQHFHALKRESAPLCSVCIANYNGVEMLADCIDSVRAQRNGTPIEIIVHDDASNDGSVDWIRQRYPDIAVLVSSQNVGFCVANNRMVAHASGDYVLLLNNDAALFPDALKTLLADAADRRTPGITTLPQYDWEDGSLVDRGCLLDPFFNPVPNLNPTLANVAYVIGACMFLRRDLWLSLGGLPEWMESLTEDLYLCGVARLRGISVQALPASGYRHRQGASFGGNRAGSTGLRTSIKRRCLSERNKTRALFILTPGLAMWPLLAAHLVALAIEAIVLSLLLRDATLLREVYAPALVTPFREWSALRTRRRDVQAARTISIAQWFSMMRWQLRKVAMLVRYGVPRVDH